NEQLNKRKTEINAYKNSLINKNLPPFSFRDINNKLWDLQTLKGKTIVLNFWFTNCDPCLREIPFLNKIVEDNNSNNIVFIAISYSDKKSIIHSNHKFPFKYHLIPNQLKYISQLQISEYPTSIIVNGSGLIKYVSVGFNEEIYKELKNALKDLAN
ncbi:MAG: TlpA family protein disulfide reductase, partial [Flavisolibacter sp.]